MECCILCQGNAECLATWYRINHGLCMFAVGNENTCHRNDQDLVYRTTDPKYDLDIFVVSNGGCSNAHDDTYLGD